MPTSLPPGEKTAFINIVKAAPYPGGPIEADRLASILNNYEDIIVAIMRQLILFAGNNQYLTQAMSVFTDSALQAVGILNGKNLPTTQITAPALLINSNYESVIVSANSAAFTILGNSTIPLVLMNTGISLYELYIGPGSTVGFLDGTAANSIINTVWLPFIKSAPSNLLAVANGTIVNQFVVDEGSNFGGYKEDTQSTCSNPVTNLVYGVITYNSVQLNWTAPSSPYLFIDIYFKQTGTQVWKKADETIGSYSTDSYTFTQLSANTSFDFKVVVICPNGGHADTQITIQTAAQ